MVQRLKTTKNNSKQIDTKLRTRKVPLYFIQESGLLYLFSYSHGKHDWFGWQRRVWLFLRTLRCSCPSLSESGFGVLCSHQREKEAVLVFVPVLVNEDTAAPERTGYPAVSKPFSPCQAIPTSLTPLSRHHDRRIPLFFLGGTKTKQAAAVQNKSSTAPQSVIRPSVPRCINPDDFRIVVLSAQCKRTPQTNTNTRQRVAPTLCLLECSGQRQRTKAEAWIWSSKSTLSKPPAHSHLPPLWLVASCVFSSQSCECYLCDAK